ncbi:tRNA(m5U54)methyltransferase [Recurvomyces mirabilis]|uniref:tRNA(M5U54)methyltransferase n=1 Tax=Recurvomyces mirabilis TaxID=574656 RepID=A0AAE0WTZ1_9PEZI|nr:tRNA(m5U54)methyltransferase [Recurvomyces mirabilis]KAK5160685.1 tRNA(m5U54)methyltransferase [Recurvomyces mirabilis]
MAQKRPFNEGKRHFKKNKKQKSSTGVSEGSNEEVLLADVRRLLQDVKIANGSTKEEQAEKELPEQWTEIDLDITEISSTGDGLAQKNGQVYVVPFTAPGDTVTAKVVRHVLEDSYTLTDFLAVKTPSKHRTEIPPCPYFSQCSGCQFQHLPYSYQLAHKREIVEKAYTNFSGLPAAAVPVVGDTIGSPLQYGYRTKLTPHFDGPPMARKDRRAGVKAIWPGVPPIGFMKKGTRKTMDIEDCPIGTEAVRLGMKRERRRVGEEIEKFQRGATLLLRESTERVAKEGGVEGVKSGKVEGEDVVGEDGGEFVHKKTCITDSKATSTEYVDEFRFDNPAGSFFQNNNSILPLVTQYIRDNILAPPTPDDSTGTQSQPKITKMIDAYCGSGFFTVALSQTFTNSIGIDISPQSITSATHNAELNNLPSDSTTFISSDANALFAAIDTANFPPAETVVVIDPPRKGCDQGFIRQLLKYGPARICYVSCNVHTQARDVGWLVAGLEAEGEGEDERAMKGLYEIESLRGFDFFPQTGHVEGVAVLRRKGAEGGVVEEKSTAGEVQAVAPPTHCIEATDAGKAS